MSCGSQQPELVSGNIFLRPFTLAKAGDRVQGHTHNFDHTTFVVRGRVLVKKSSKIVDEAGEQLVINGAPAWHLDVEREFAAGQHFLVEAHKRHEIIALENDSRVTCIYSHRDAQGEIVQHFDGWMPAYQ